LAVDKLKIDSTDPDGVRSQILFCLSTLFRLMGNQKENLFSPFQVPSKFVPIIQRYESFFMSVFTLKEVGLKLESHDDGYWVHFELKHPLYVYTKISEACIAPQTD